MRIILIIFIVLIISGGSVWMVEPAIASGKIILRCADVHAQGYPTVEGVRYMDQLLQKKSNGRLEIRIYPDSSLGSEQSVVEMVRLGALDMGRLSVTQVAEVAPEMGVFILPYLFRDDVHKWKVLEGTVGVKLLKGLEKHGLIGLCFQESGHRSFYNSKRSVFSPKDLEGLKLRVQPSQIMIKLVEFLGASPVPINYSEVYSALAAGVIDGAENNIPSYVTSGHYKVARYYSIDRHSSIPEVVIVSKKTWLRLTPGEQKILKHAALESVNYQRAKWAEFETQCRQRLIKEGCIVNDVNIQAFQQAIKPFFEKYAHNYRYIIQGIREIN